MPVPKVKSILHNHDHQVVQYNIHGPQKKMKTIMKTSQLQTMMMPQTMNTQKMNHRIKTKSHHLYSQVE
eukprot:14364422-Ditylum_brightwellii.AAC.1